jgi:hypothetical protein
MKNLLILAEGESQADKVWRPAWGSSHANDTPIFEEESFSLKYGIEILFLES